MNQLDQSQLFDYTVLFNSLGSVRFWNKLFLFSKDAAIDLKWQ